MSTLLVEALGQLNLKPGQTYRTTVNGHEVEVRMLDTPSPEEPREERSQFDDMVMMNLWLDIPPSPDARTVIAQCGELTLPPPLELDESDLAPE